MHPPPMQSSPQPVPAQQPLRHQEQGRGDAAVDVHLLELGTIDLAGNATRREQTGQAGGSRQNLAEQGHGLVAAVRGYGPHVPDAGALTVQIGRRHQQPPPARVLGRHGIDQGFIDKGMDQGVQGLALEQAAGKGRGQTAQAQQVGGMPPDIGVGQTLVPGRPEKGEGRDQRPGADACHQGELGPLSGFRQADQGPCPIGAARRPAGNGQHVEPPGGPARTRQGQPIRRRLQRSLGLLNAQTNIGKARDPPLAGRRRRQPPPGQTSDGMDGFAHTASSDVARHRSNDEVWLCRRTPKVTGFHAL